MIAFAPAWCSAVGIRWDLVTQDAGELTSNYTSLRLSALRRQSTPSAVPGAPPPFQSLLDAADLGSRALHSSRPMLVMVRNRDFRKLSKTVAQVEPLSNEWEYSIRKIPAGKVPELLAGVSERWSEARP